MSSDNLTALEPRHKAACRMKVEGKPNAYIAAQLGVQPRTLVKWFGQKLVKDEVLRLQESIEERFVLELAGHAGEALKGLSEFAKTNAEHSQFECDVCGWWGNNTSPHGPLDTDKKPTCFGPWTRHAYIGEATKLDALREILDRFEPTTRTRDLPSKEEGGGDVNLVNIIAQMPDTELAKMVRTFRETGVVDVPDATGNGTPALPA